MLENFIYQENRPLPDLTKDGEERLDKPMSWALSWWFSQLDEELAKRYNNDLRWVVALFKFDEYKNKAFPRYDEYWDTVTVREFFSQENIDYLLERIVSLIEAQIYILLDYIFYVLPPLGFFIDTFFWKPNRLMYLWNQSKWEKYCSSCAEGISNKIGNGFTAQDWIQMTNIFARIVEDLEKNQKDAVGNDKILIDYVLAKK